MDDFKKFFFLLIKPKIIALYAIDNNNQVLFEEESCLKTEITLDNDYKILEDFLDENIFKFESKFNLHIEDINLIIDNNNFVTIDLSLIENFKNKLRYNDNFSKNFSNIKYSVLKTNDNYKLIHMLNKKFIVDKKSFSTLPKDESLKKSIFFEIKFICLKKDIFKNIQKILSRYQISVKNISYFNYVCSFETEEKDNISIMANKLAQGYNSKEIILIKKNPKNRGFFEKFFKFFS